jgi:predicted AlkP superfamily pyrophosphatase or phosphodiesterase
MDGLRARSLLNDTNIIFLADHGMTALSTDRIIRLETLVNLADMSVVTWYPVLNILPNAGKEQAVYDALHGAHPHLQCVLVERAVDTSSG